MSLRAELRVLRCSCLSKKLSEFRALIQLSPLSQDLAEGGQSDSSSKATAQLSLAVLSAFTAFTGLLPAVSGCVHAGSGQLSRKRDVTSK